MGVEGGFPQEFETHFGEFVEPPLCQRCSALQRQVERVEERVVDVKDGSLADFVNCVVYAFDDLGLLVTCEVLVLDLSQERDNFLRRRLQQVCVVHRPDFECSRFEQLLVVQLTKFVEGH